MPIAHGEGNYFAAARRAARLEANRQVVFRYATPAARSTDAANPNGVDQQHRRHLQRGAQRRRPDAAPRARLRGGARQRRRAACCSSRWCQAARSSASRQRQVGRPVHAAASIDDHDGSRTARPHPRRVRSHRRSCSGREPNLTELGIFSVMWSEHCSYKSSRVHLKTLPTDGPRVLQGPGENAGAVDIGDGLAAVFKIESHNHPSFIEPYQGAATGVGGIIRDIFTMGARPIALLNALRFGRSMARRRAHAPHRRRRRRGHRRLRQQHRHPDDRRRDRLRRELRRQPARQRASASASRRRTRSSRARRRGVGNPVYYVGAKTGRDGIHGATMASAEFDEKSAEKRPAVQVGDPFMEKLLLEACLEVMATDALVGIQDMGAAGPDLLDLRDGRARRRRHRDRRDARAAARDRHDAVRDHAVRIAGAHAARRQEGPRGGGRGDLREVGPARGAHRRGHRPTA